MWVKIKKKAFTLAEVLITLGIIGVVAAITIPSLMTAYEKHVTISKLQRAISVLNQAYRLSVDDLGEVSLSEALNLGSEEYFNTYWSPYLKAITVCTSYSQCGYKSNNPWVYPNKNKVGLGVVVLDRRTTFYTADGFLYVLFISMGSKVTESGVEGNGTVLVDINGGKGPNRFGRDVFYLTRSRDEGKGIQPLYQERVNSVVNEHCSTGSDGFSCAEKIRRAGWKIEKDYPW